MDDDVVIEVTREEWLAGCRRALADLGLTYSELERQARDRGGNFTSAQAHVLWVSIGDTVTAEELGE
ncbi:hypothetical protein O3S80_03775 [Streptomyces sp. Lzd4kr]|nr:hypothetical protein [Streptomyces sp. Lzd4kr]